MERTPDAIVLDRAALAGLDVGALARLCDERRADDRCRFDQMIVHAQTARCRWAVLRQYFGEEPDPAPCGHCDNCRRSR